MCRTSPPASGHPQHTHTLVSSPWPPNFPLQAIASLEPTKLKPPARVTAIAAGGDHSMAVTVGGSLLAFGSNRHGQLGTGDRMDRMVPTEVPLTLESEQGLLVRGMQVQCGAQHTLVLVQNHGRMEVRAAGDNSYGEQNEGTCGGRHGLLPLAIAAIGVVTAS